MGRQYMKGRNQMQKENIMKQLEKQAWYAQRSLSRDLLYPTYGQACMAHQLEAISSDEFMEISHMTIFYMDTHVQEFEQRGRETIHQMLDLALDINGLEQRRQSITGDLPTVFFEFSGHVAKAEVKVYPQGWSAGEEACKTFYGYCDKADSIEGAIREIMALKDETPGAATPRESV